MRINEIVVELQELLTYKAQEIDLAINLFKEAQKGRRPDMKEVQDKLTLALGLLEEIRPAIDFIKDNERFAKKMARRLI